MRISSSASFTASSAAPSHARTWLDGVLHDEGAVAPPGAGLLTSELVADAIGRASGSVMVSLEIDDERLHVEVSDADSGLVSTFEADEGARSIRRRLVRALATRWGAEGDRHRTATWFELRAA